jgi:hypothetical protein
VVSQLLEDGGFAVCDYKRMVQGNPVPLYPPGHMQVQVGDIVEYGLLADSVIYTNLD